VLELKQSQLYIYTKTAMDRRHTHSNGSNYRYNLAIVSYPKYLQIIQNLLKI